MGAKVDNPDRRVAAVAGRQHGIVTVAQLHECGVGRNGVRRRVEAGRLLRIHRGVYAVGHRPSSWEAAWMAAVLAYGEGAALSHGSAAALWGLLRPISGPVDVSVPSNAGLLGRTGVRLYRRASLASPPCGSARLVTVRRSIPVTALGRTIADLRGAVAPKLLRRAIRQAELFHGFEAADLSDGTRSDLERDFLSFCSRHRLPPPQVNVRIGVLTVDFLWRERRLIVETDDHRYHRGSVAFEEDHLRDLQLRRLGYAVRRYTGDQLRECPTQIAEELGEILM